MCSFLKHDVPIHPLCSHSPVLFESVLTFPHHYRSSSAQPHISADASVLQTRRRGQSPRRRRRFCHRRLETPPNGRPQKPTETDAFAPIRPSYRAAPVIAGGRHATHAPAATLLSAATRRVPRAGQAQMLVFRVRAAAAVFISSAGTMQATAGLMSAGLKINRGVAIAQGTVAAIHLGFTGAPRLPPPPLTTNVALFAAAAATQLTNVEWSRSLAHSAHRERRHHLLQEFRCLTHCSAGVINEMGRVSLDGKAKPHNDRLGIGDWHTSLGTDFEKDGIDLLSSPEVLDDSNRINVAPPIPTRELPSSLTPPTENKKTENDVSQLEQGSRIDIALLEEPAIRQSGWSAPRSPGGAQKATQFT